MPMAINVDSGFLGGKEGCRDGRANRLRQDAHVLDAAVVQRQLQLVVTPLNILGTQNEGDLAKLGIRAVAVRGETATPKLFREIAEGKYQAIVANPEEVMKPGGGFEKLWEVENFTSKLISVVWDE
ncbi:hypothetical protein FOMPIDRAFT_94423, partial [Fomitopsis schrenkii]